MTNPLPESQTTHQDAADRPPVHTDTAVRALTDLKAAVEAKHVEGLISTDQLTQGLAALETLLDLVK